MSICREVEVSCLLTCLFFLDFFIFSAFVLFVPDPAEELQTGIGPDVDIVRR